MADDNKKAAPAKTSTEAVKKTEEKLTLGKRIAKWFREMKTEVKKVLWPTRAQVVTNTAIALGVMGAAALVLWGFDQIATLGVSTLLDLVG